MKRRVFTLALAALGSLAVTALTVQAQRNETVAAASQWSGAWRADGQPDVEGEWRATPGGTFDMTSVTSSLGLVVYESGAARWLAWVLLGQITSVPVLLQPFVIVLAVAALHLLFSSNTVTASIIVPILVALATDLKLDPWMVVAPAAFTSSLAFILVSEGPTTIIPYSSGYFSIKDMARAGVLMTIAAAACVAISVALNTWIGA
jgi:di/tricarboxylate transporter